MYQVCGKCQENRIETNRDPLTRNGLDESETFVDRAKQIFMGHEYRLAGKSQNEAVTPNFRIL